jgi:hypothetical protein
LSDGRTPTSPQIRTMHRYGFRSGEWADLLTTAPAPDKSDCYVVRFEDGVTDYWVVNDPAGQYEFREACRV